MSTVVLLYNVLQNERQRRENRIQHTRRRFNIRTMKTVALLNDISFRNNFRVSRNNFEALLNNLGRYMKQGQTKYAISVETKLLITLKFLAQGSYQLAVGNDLCASVSKSSVCLILKEVLDIMNNYLCRKLITFPTVRRMRGTATRVLQKYKFPGVIGFIDGTHISIVGPKDDAEFPEFLYVNRKHFHSLNVQIVCDDKYYIWNVNARFPGSSHDSYIWKQTSIRSYLHENYIDRNIWLLGDSGYPLEPILLTPFINPETERAVLFNEYHSKCRSTVERCIGVLKARWRCLKQERGLHYHPVTAGKIVNACVALHNFCVANDEEYLNTLFEVDDVIPQDQIREDNGVYYDMAVAIRENITDYLQDVHGV